MVIGSIYRALGGGGMQWGTSAILKVHHDMGRKIALFTRLRPVFAFGSIRCGFLRRGRRLVS